MTIATREVDENLRVRLKQQWDDETIVELTALIAFQNLSSKFNAALARALFRRGRRAGGSRRRDVGAARKRSLLHPDDAEQASGEKPRRHHEYPAE